MTPLPRSPRNAGFDALKGALTVLVLFHHTAITYGAIGGWYYKEIPPGPAWSSQLLTLFCAINQAFFMGLFFLLAGYFTPAALRSKGAARFLFDRAIRLGVPVLVFGWVLGPMTIALSRTAQGRPFLETWSALIERGRFDIGPPWFAWALLLFCMATAFIWRAGGARCGLAADRNFPSDTTLFITALITGSAAFLLRLIWPVGVSVFGGLQLGYFASYVVLFVAGVVAASPGWLERLPARQVRRWRRIGWICLPILPIAALLGPSIPVFAGNTAGGWNLMAAIYAFWEPLIAWGIILALLSRYQRRFTTLEGRWSDLARRAFAIYVIHPPIVVGVALLLAPVAAPALVKFVVTGSLSAIVCYGVAGGLLRVPGVGRVL